MLPDDIGSLVTRLAANTERQSDEMASAVRQEEIQGFLTSELDNQAPGFVEKIRQQRPGAIKAVTGFDDGEFE